MNGGLKRVAAAQPGMVGGMIEKQSGSKRPIPGYGVREIGMEQDLRHVLQAWRTCNSEFSDHTMHCDPDWILEQNKNQKENGRVYICERDGKVVGAVPFVRRKQPLLCELGDLVVAKFPMDVLSLQGYTPNLPAEESAYDALFHSILNSRFDAIFMNYVKADSFLWNYLHTSPLIQRSLRFYSKRGPEPHLLARLKGSFETYMQKFSARSRRNRLHEIKRLRERGNVELVRATRESHVNAYLAAFTEVSRKSWQYKRLGWGIGAADPDVVRSKLIFLAQHGWLRAYLLTCGGEACSFILGWQYASRFYAAAIGFDPSWASYRVGTVLQLLVLEDLYKENTPELYDFATFAEYKAQFSTESYLEASVWLFRRRVYPVLVDSVHRMFDRTSMKTGAILNRFGLKAKVRHLMRGTQQ